jgi:predicted peptidase
VPGAGGPADVLRRIVAPAAWVVGRVRHGVDWIVGRFVRDALPAPGRQVVRTHVATRPGGVDRLRYLLYLPPGQADGELRPLLLYLHGAGERGHDPRRVARTGVARLAAREGAFDLVVVSPQAPPGEPWFLAWKAGRLIELLDHVMARHPVDPDRVYVTGVSMGGFGAWELVTRHPDRFAAMVSVSGTGDMREAQRVGGLPIWAFQGGLDPIVPAGIVTEMVEAVRAAGNDRVRLTLYADLGHDCERTAYADPELWRWLLAQRRGPSGQEHRRGEIDHERQ